MVNRSHNRRNVIDLLVGAALCALAACSTAVRAQEETAHSSLVVVAQAGVETVQPAEGKRDFGDVDMLRTTSLEQTFTLRNAGNTPVTIDHVEPSCGCTSAVLSEGGAAGNSHPDVAPGAEVSVRATLNVIRLRAGQFEKYLLVFVKGSSAPAVTLELAGRLKELVSFVPRVLDFGRPQAGQGRTLNLTVKLDPRLLVDREPPPLVSSYPDLRIVEEKPASPPQPDAPDAPVIRTYVLTLPSDARLGLMSGKLSFAPYTHKTVASEVVDALADASVTLIGQVVGRIYANPYIVVFGTVISGTEAIRQVTIGGQTSDDLKDLKLSCSMPAMSARLLPPEKPTVGGPTQPPALPEVTLEIKLGAQATPGPLKAEVRVTTRDGEHLILPVIGTVLKPQSSAH